MSLGIFLFFPSFRENSFIILEYLHYRRMPSKTLQQGARSGKVPSDEGAIKGNTSCCASCCCDVGARGIGKGRGWH